MKNIILFILISGFCACGSNGKINTEDLNKGKLKALIIDGQNNHGIWPKTTMMMKDYLIQTGLFEVAIARTNNNWCGPHFNKSIGVDTIIELLTLYPIEGQSQRKIVEEPEPDVDFNPTFKDYDVVISNLGWKTAEWPKETQNNFEKYMKEGGGFVVVHAANNSWPEWQEFNKMIGVGGWSGRTIEKDGPQIYYDSEGNFQKQTSNHDCGSHGPEMEYLVETRAHDHPIMKGLPDKWIHQKDELYERLCGPAENVTVLATSFADREGNAPPWDDSVKGTHRNEPILMAIDYHEGRVFHNTMGHMDYSMSCIGFITTFQRGCEWAATGFVTQAIPSNFPSQEKGTKIQWKN